MYFVFMTEKIVVFCELTDETLESTAMTASALAIFTVYACLRLNR